MPRHLSRLTLASRLAFIVFVSIFISGLLVPFSTVEAQAQPRRPAHGQAASTAIPSPRSVLGFTPGDDRTVADWKQITDYFARLDRASNRVVVQTIGETTLKRPLVVAFISAPENIRDLEKYKEIQRRLADPRTVRDDAERERLIREGRTVVAVSCSIHSTEVVASQMSMQLAYELATAQDAATHEILQNTILLLIPSANPDGTDIVADWYRRSLGTPYEGTEPPELYHHYAGHDNNRDWFMLNLKETQAITRLFWKEWFPPIVYDVHQQGATGSRFFIPPFFDPPNPRIAPLLLREVGLIGHKVAADLQAAGEQGVITNALYDTWWHGGFRTAPYYHNSIGILSEAASAKLMTPTLVTRDQLARASSRGMPSALQTATNFPEPWPGGIWRPGDIMRIEMSATRSILSMAAKYRERYLGNFHELGRRALDYKIAPERPLAYLVPAGQGHDEAVAKMIGALAAQGVEVHRLERELHGIVQGALHTVAPNTTAPNSNPPKGGQTTPATARDTTPPIPPQTEQDIPLGSYLIFLAQPYRANVETLFERQVYPDRRTAGGEAERPYDVAGWTLPLQMGVETLPVMSLRETASERRLTLVRDENDVRRALGLSLKVDDKSPIQNPVTRPARVALYKSWTGSMDEGWTRYVFDAFNVAYTSLRDAEIRAGRLQEKYDVIILPSQSARDITEGRAQGTAPPEFTGGITAAGVGNLRAFVEAGGTLVCFDASTELAIKQFNLPLRNVLEGVKSSEFYGPGSIVRIDVDTSHTLARGLPHATDAYFINSRAFEVTDPARVRTVARYAERDVLRSGWLLGEKLIAGKTALAEVPFERGRIILFAFRPQHRAQTWGTFPFIFNALNL